MLKFVHKVFYEFILIITRSVMLEKFVFPIGGFIFNQLCYNFIYSTAFNFIYNGFLISTLGVFLISTFNFIYNVFLISTFDFIYSSAFNVFLISTFNFRSSTVSVFLVSFTSSSSRRMS